MKTRFHRAAPACGGFTLIEIVLVLVLIGILSSMAVPKYFDFQRQAEARAATSAIDEAQTRILSTFAEKLLSGVTCAQAAEAVSDVKTVADSVSGSGGVFGGWRINAPAITEQGTAVTVTSLSSGNVYENIGKLILPSCLINDASAEPRPDPDQESGGGNGGGSNGGNGGDNGGVDGSGGNGA